MSKDKISRKAYNQAYHVIHKDKIRLRKKAWTEDNKEKTKVYGKKWRVDNKDKCKIVEKAYYEANKNRIKDYAKTYSKLNKDKLSVQAKVYYLINKNKIRAYQNAYVKQKRKTNPDFRLNCSMHTAISRCLKNEKGGEKWLALVDYSVDDLKKHLEKQFTDGMTWGNYGKNGWHIDHKIPLSVFNFTKPEHEDFRRCWALKNLQPMWAIENIKKHAKITKPFQPSLLM